MKLKLGVAKLSWSELKFNIAEYRHNIVSDKRVLPEASFLEEWHPDNLPDKLPDSYGIKIMPQVYL